MDPAQNIVKCMHMDLKYYNQHLGAKGDQAAALASSCQIQLGERTGCGGGHLRLVHSQGCPTEVYGFEKGDQYV